MAERSGSTIAIWVIAAVLAALAGWRLLGGAGEGGGPAPVTVDSPVGGRAAARGAGVAGAPVPGGSPAGGGETVYVHVAGAVRRPGLLRLRADARVAGALSRAGGATRRADLTLVNLAARVQDGQQIVVPVRGAAAGAASGASSSGASAGTGAAPIRLATATVEQLEAIDGIGPTLAGRILEYRDSQGAVSSIDELAEVDGIGEQRLATLREALQP